MREILLILIVMLLAPYSFARTVKTYSSLPPAAANAYYYNQLAQVERSVYGRSYDSQNLPMRINRLESSVFSRTFPNMTYEQRINNLIMNYNNNVVVPNNFSNGYTYPNGIMNGRYVQPQAAYYPPIQSNGGIKSTLGAIGNMFFGGGMPTGLTPQIGPDTDYMDMMDPGYSRNIRTNRGWEVDNSQVGSGSKVTILD